MKFRDHLKAATAGLDEFDRHITVVAKHLKMPPLDRDDSGRKLISLALLMAEVTGVADEEIQGDGPRAGGRRASQPSSSRTDGKDGNDEQGTE